MSTIAVEVCAFRLLAPSFGSTQFITTNVLGVVLASLAGGYAFGGRLADRRPEPRILYLLSIAAALLLVILPFIADPILEAARPAITHQNASLFLGTLASMAAIFAVPMFLLGTVSPFTIRLLATGDERAGSRSGLVFALSTVGSIAGAYLPSLLTIGLLGTRASIQLFGGVVLVSAAAGLFASRAKSLGALSSIFIAVPTTLILYPPHRYRPANVLDERETDYHLLRVVRDDKEKRNLLEINEGLSYHSMQYDDGRLSPGVWGYFLLLPPAVRPVPQPGGAKPAMDICIIGLAAGTMATQFQKLYDRDYNLHIDGVEVDPKIIELARKYFALDERFLQIWIEDGRTFLARSEKKYDLILGDAYRQPYIPPHLVTKEYFSIAKQHLKPGGICAVNVGALDTDSVVLRGIQNSMIDVFASKQGEGAVERIQVRNNDVPFSNFICMAGDGPILQRVGSVSQKDLLFHRAAAMHNWAVLLKDKAAPNFTDDRAPVEWYTDLSLLQFAAKK